jgi:hypothetical protein
VVELGHKLSGAEDVRGEAAPSAVGREKLNRVKIVDQARALFRDEASESTTQSSSQQNRMTEPPMIAAAFTGISVMPDCSMLMVNDKGPLPRCSGAGNDEGPLPRPDLAAARTRPSTPVPLPELDDDDGGKGADSKVSGDEKGDGNSSRDHPPSSSATHRLFPTEARAYAVQLLLLGHNLSRQLKLAAAAQQGMLDPWVDNIMPRLVVREYRDGSSDAGDGTARATAARGRQRLGRPRQDRRQQHQQGWRRQGRRRQGR